MWSSSPLAAADCVGPTKELRWSFVAAAELKAAEVHPKGVRCAAATSVSPLAAEASGNGAGLAPLPVVPRSGDGPTTT